MENIEVKEEIKECLYNQCRTCLCIGRRMVPSGEFIDVFQSLTSGFKSVAVGVSEDLVLCWECNAILRKFKRFQMRAEKANEMIKSGENASFALSSLTTVILSGAKPYELYMSSQVSHDDITREENVLNRHFIKQSMFIDESDPKSIYENFDFEDRIEEFKLDKTCNKKKKCNNKWTKKQTVPNKKPNFKMINADVDLVFSKFNLSEEEINKYVIKEEPIEDETKEFTCTECGIGFKERKLLQYHFRYHSKASELYVCDECFVIYSNKNNLEAHIQDHNHIYKCKVCEYVYCKKNQRESHVKTHSKVVQCLKCSSIFRKEDEFFQHYKELHEKYKCDHCGFTFKKKYTLAEHIRRQHTNHVCKVCSKSFPRYSSLWLHTKTQHAETAAPSYCVECDRTFPDDIRFKWHLTNTTKHTPKKKKRIPCPECDKVFSKNIYMKDHYNLIHLKKYKYRCDDCDKNYIRNADLIKHKRKIHEGIMPEKNKICNLCGRKFSTNKILENHMRTHTGERPYTCSHCPANFAQTAALTSHIRSIHSGVV